MSNIQKYIISAVVILLIVIGVVCFTNFGGGRVSDNSFGSVSTASEYHSTTTYNNGVPNIANHQVLQLGQGTLGSVVITGAVAGAMTLYDATTTTNGAIYGTTTLAAFPASTAVGTYTFDVFFQKGLLIDVVAGSVPTSTITWR